MSKKNKTVEKELAKLLYTKEFLSQKEISERIGVSEKTISKWAATDNWKRLRQSMVITKGEQLMSLYEQLDELNTTIRTREEGNKYANSKESDIISKLSASIKNLERETNIADIVSVMSKFLNYVRAIDIEKAKEISYFSDVFIKESLKAE
jgi:transposase